MVKVIMKESGRTGFIRNIILMGSIVATLMLLSGCASYLSGRYESMWKNYTLPKNSDKGLVLYSVSWKSSRPKIADPILVEPFLDDKDSFAVRYRKLQIVPSFGLWEPIKIYDDKGEIAGEAYVMEWPAGVYQISPKKNKGFFAPGFLILGRIEDRNFSSAVKVSVTAGKVAYVGNFVFGDNPNDKNWSVEVRNEFRRDVAAFLKFAPGVEEKDAISEFKNLQPVIENK